MHEHGSKNNDTALSLALQNEDVDIVRLLLNHPRIDVNMRLVNSLCLH